METQIKVEDVYDKDLNFLIGSGASFGLFPTLELRMKSPEGTAESIETVATRLDHANDRARLTLLFMHYYRSCIRPVCEFTPESAAGDPVKEAVLKNYEQFLSFILRLLARRRPLDKRCNVFTTNYDGCLAYAADVLQQRGHVDFVLNDGTRGFRQRTLQARNFDSYLAQVGVFEQHRESVPQINVIHLHGSVYWRKTERSITVDYGVPAGPDLVPGTLGTALQQFSNVLGDPTKTHVDLPTYKFRLSTIDEFWGAYNKLPIVNPTKWKFHETVFEEHYYQMLRALSYELEKPNAVLITFGFSFADEHILNLVRRSLSNPRLQVFIGCFNAAEVIAMEQRFSTYPNVKCFSADPGPLSFTEFNEVFGKVGVTEHPAEPAGVA